MELKDIKKYIKLYDLDRFIFEEIGPKARKRGFLRFLEFYRICMWKSSRPKKRYIKNRDKVENVTRKAFSVDDEIKKINTLCELEGVRVPTASAILTVVFPEKYGVIDVRGVEMLNELGFNISKLMSPQNWLKYLEVIRKLAKENHVTPREVDMALFAMHREKQIQDFRNLYT